MTASNPAAAAVSTPDAAGYAWYDQASGATYNYVDISATGTNVISGDDSRTSLALSVPFTFYGVSLNQVDVSTNGFIASATPNSDFGNTCPQPGFVDGGGARIAVLHDDLVSTVYHQYFNAAQATAIGFPGTTNGVTIVQWVGTHFTGSTAMNAQVVLFHDSGAIQMQYLVDVDTGSGATIGIQNAAATIGLTYACNTLGSISPGATAVRFAPTPQDFHINELRVDQDGTDNDEYVEIVGPPGAALDRLAYVVLGDSPTGSIESVTYLGGRFIPSDGVFLLAENTLSLGTPDQVGSLNFENTDTVTHMLLRDFSGALNGDVDTNDDGTLDVTPWSSVDDVVTLVNATSTEFDYGPGASCVAGTDCNSIATGSGPFQVFRCGDGTGSYNLGPSNFSAVPVVDSPGEPNHCACGDGIPVNGETCDEGGNTVACDSDCTLPSCGDGLSNPAAGEACDDGGESATCNADCTAAVCGDGVLNAAAGEQCDDGGESATCDADCTPAACGDGTANVTAGETCDDGGESATCDVDCTAAACGDDVVNVSAGEQCDDGGRSAMCNADCTNASCGDGVVNAAAGEACDDAGESATCNLDCSAASCGDGIVNATAGEACDDAGESASCDDDCSDASCGDGVLNATAGEACDDGNTDDGDGCSAICEEESGSSSGGSDSGGSSGGSDSGGSDSGGSDSGTTGVADTSGGTAADSSGSASASDTDATASASASDSDTNADSGDSSGTAGAGGTDSGCSCNGGAGDAGNAGWAGLGLLGLVATRRRRRR
ncbi:MAG: hypothetical protein IPH07_19695 [Deltaproteobacteria bacterium]|nr:hypothetical protein [Deltaproteobacteria bacterium]